jgi:hypothetical protein
MQATKQQLGKGKVGDQCRSSKSEKALIIEAKSRMVFFFQKWVFVKPCAITKENE